MTPPRALRSASLVVAAAAVVALAAACGDSKKPKVDAAKPQDVANSADLIGRTKAMLDLVGALSRNSGFGNRMLGAPTRWRLLREGLRRAPCTLPEILGGFTALEFLLA